MLFLIDIFLQNDQNKIEQNQELIVNYRDFDLFHILNQYLNETEGLEKCTSSEIKIV